MPPILTETVREDALLKTIEKQREYFRSGETLSVPRRLSYLKTTKKAISDRREDMVIALSHDTGRGRRSCIEETETVLSVLQETLQGLTKWQRPEVRFTSPGGLRQKTYRSPLGVVFLECNVQYPFLSILGPLTSIIGGGNTAIIAENESAPACFYLFKKMLFTVFPPQLVTVAPTPTGQEKTCFDKIYRVNNIGNTDKYPLPCVILSDGDINDAARKIVILKSSEMAIERNDVGPIYVVSERAEELVVALKREIGSIREKRRYSMEDYLCYMEICETFHNRICFGGREVGVERTVLYPIALNEVSAVKNIPSAFIPIVPFHDKDLLVLLDYIARRIRDGLSLFSKKVLWAESLMQSRMIPRGCINEVSLPPSFCDICRGEWGFRDFTRPSVVFIG